MDIADLPTSTPSGLTHRTHVAGAKYAGLTVDTAVMPRVKPALTTLSARVSSSSVRNGSSPSPDGSCTSVSTASTASTGLCTADTPPALVARGGDGTASAVAPQPAGPKAAVGVAGYGGGAAAASGVSSMCSPPPPENTAVLRPLLFRIRVAEQDALADFCSLLVVPAWITLLHALGDTAPRIGVPQGFASLHLPELWFKFGCLLAARFISSRVARGLFARRVAEAGGSAVASAAATAVVSSEELYQFVWAVVLCSFSTFQTPAMPTRYSFADPHAT